MYNALWNFNFIHVLCQYCLEGYKQYSESYKIWTQLNQKYRWNWWKRWEWGEAAPKQTFPSGRLWSASGSLTLLAFILEGNGWKHSPHADRHWEPVLWVIYIVSWSYPLLVFLTSPINAGNQFSRGGMPRWTALLIYSDVNAMLCELKSWAL